MNTEIKIRKVTLTEAPFREHDDRQEWARRGLWPAAWISGAGRDNDRSFAYRNTFTLSEPTTVRIHLAADAEYRLYIDGTLLAQGAEAGDVDNWFFDSYDLTLAAGKYMVVVMVLSYGDFAAVAQLGIRHGLVLAAEGAAGALFNTGTASWQCRELTGLTLQKSPYWIFGYLGGVTRFDAGVYPCGVETGAGADADWRKPTVLYPAANADICNEYRWPYLLRPSTLPEPFRRRVSDGKILQVSAGVDLFWRPDDALDEDTENWKHWAMGSAVTIPAHTVRRVLLLLPDYVCAWPYLTVSGGCGTELSLGWAEAMFCENRPDGVKGDRAEWRNRYFIGFTDVFIASGKPAYRFFCHRWRAGRYLMLTVTTADEPLTLEPLELYETRYPLEFQAGFHSGTELDALIAPCLRTLQMCSHDTFMDCPYYERLMYIGDTRLQMLLTYAVSRDTRLADKALRLFAAGRLTSGLLPSRYPSSVTQIIPGFSLLWIGMLHDAVYWRDPAILSSLLPVAKGIADAFEPYRNTDGLLENLRTWNFIDWADGWSNGVPPGGEKGISSTVNWLWCYTVVLLADLCRLAGQPEVEKYYRRLAGDCSKALLRHCWNERQGLFADTPEQTSFSQHAQCLAVLSDLLPDHHRQRITGAFVRRVPMTACTVYFSHYLFEAARTLGLDSVILAGLQPWREFRNLHLQTLLERPEPSRSDCHAWSAHPLFHFLTTILGIRPATAGFRQVSIEPHPGSLRQLSGKVPHPSGGEIAVSLTLADNEWQAEIDLPPGLEGDFHYGGIASRLHPGRNRIVSEQLAALPV